MATLPRIVSLSNSVQATKGLAASYTCSWLLLQDAVLQNAAFQDLCYLAEASGPAAWRRKMVFDKDNGEAWQKLSSACMDEVCVPSWLTKLLLIAISHMHVITSLAWVCADVLRVWGFHVLMSVGV